MASKRIYQLAKEFECDEKKIIEFLTEQGIKVANRLSAVSEDTYNLLKAKLFAPPPPPPPPETKPEPVVEKPAQATAPDETTDEDVPAQKKKKKKKKKHQQEEQFDPELEEFKDQPLPFALDNATVANSLTQAVYGAAITAGNNFIENYVPSKKKKGKMYLTRSMDAWGIIQDLKIEDPDISPICYWQAVNKLTTKAYKLLREYGLKNRDLLREIREAVKLVGLKYEPCEIFTDEENQRFESQQKFMFLAFGHGMGAVNDNLYELKMYAERKKAYCEHMSFVDYLTNPDSMLEIKVPMPFFALAEAVAYSVRSVVFHTDFYRDSKPQIVRAIKNFFEWIDGYKKLKEQGASAEKLEKYLKLEEKFFNIVEFMSYDNLITLRKNKKIIPFDVALDLLNDYRDNMDDPDAERNFKYKVRGLCNVIYKTKEYIFLYQFAELEPHKDYRTPEMIAEAEAKAAAEKENLAAQSDEA